MAWRDALRPASFRGVPFLVESASLTAGRRLARHEYPQRDLPWMEDMGRRAREYAIEAFIIGPDYMAGRDRLIAALEEPGAGTLAHPWLGSVSVTLSEASLSESRDAGGMARFSLSFVEAGADVMPSVTPDAHGVFGRSAKAVEEAADREFLRTFRVTGFPAFVAANTAAFIASVLSTVGVPVPAFLTRALALIDLPGLSSADGISGLAALCAASPSALAGTAWASMVEPDAAERLAGTAFPPMNARYPTPARRQEQANRDAFGALARAASVTGRISGAVADVLAGAGGTLDYSGAVVKSREDANALRRVIVSAADESLLDPATPPELGEAVVRMRTDAGAAITNALPFLPILFRERQNATRPALVAAHALYGADWWRYDREREIVARNRLPHPGFVPAGFDLALALPEGMT